MKIDCRDNSQGLDFEKIIVKLDGIEIQKKEMIVSADSENGLVEVYRKNARHGKYAESVVLNGVVEIELNQESEAKDD